MSCAEWLLIRFSTIVYLIVHYFRTHGRYDYSDTFLIFVIAILTMIFSIVCMYFWNLWVVVNLEYSKGKYSNKVADVKLNTVERLAETNSKI